MNTEWIRTGAVALCLCLGLMAGRAQEIQIVQSVTFKQGRVLVPEGGKMVETTNDVTLPGDILVVTNGVFRVQKGKERQLREGQTIGADGMLTSRDGSVVPVTDHLVVKGGRVQVVKDGEGMPLAGEFALPDGSRISPDGTVKGRDGRLRRLLDGQLLKLDGAAIPVTDTISLQGGKVILFKDGGRVELKRGQVMAMSDGTRVNGDGTVIRPGGMKITVKEGEVIKIPGVISPRK